MRRYAISANVAAHEKQPPDDVLTGNWSVGPWDAAKNYAGLWLPGYRVVSCRYVQVQDTEKFGLHTLYKAELVNSDQSFSAVLYVREL